jgi:hypothetical protein
MASVTAITFCSFLKLLERKKGPPKWAAIIYDLCWIATRSAGSLVYFRTCAIAPAPSSRWSQSDHLCLPHINCGCNRPVPLSASPFLFNRNMGRVGSCNHCRLDWSACSLVAARPQRTMRSAAPTDLFRESQHMSSAELRSTPLVHRQRP